MGLCLFLLTHNCRYDRKTEFDMKYRLKVIVGNSFCNQLQAVIDYLQANKG